MRLLLALGVLGGASWIAYAFVPSACVPVTAESEVFCLRLWTPALFGMTAGFFGLRQWAAIVGWSGVERGFLVIAGGAALLSVSNLVDYWVFSDVPIDGPDGGVRAVLGIGFLFGIILVLIGAIATGLLLILSRRRSIRTRLLGSLMVSVVSFALFVGLLALGVLAVVACLYTLLITRPGPDPATQPA
jgi:hypothetical protein